MNHSKNLLEEMLQTPGWDIGIWKSRIEAELERKNKKSDEELIQALKNMDDDDSIVLDKEDFRRLLDYRNSYEEIVVRCRNTPGRCFCGIHISYTMKS